MAPPPILPPKDQTFLSPNNSNSRISSNSRSSLNSTGSNSNSFVDQDLAEAVRDSVHIKSESPQPQSQSHYRESLLLSSTGNNHISKQPPLPSLNPLIPRRTPSPNTNTNNMSVYQPTHNYSHSSPDMSTIGQPSLPSTRMTQLTTPQNPFEDDEVEPAGTGRIKPPGTGHISNRSFGNNSNLESEGLVQPNRAKFNRSQTG